MSIQQDSSHPSGVSGGPRDGVQLAVARDRKADAALSLRRDHVGWEEIAETLGYPTPRHALLAVEQALQRNLATDESKEFMRHLAGRWLQDLLYPMMVTARDDESPE